MGRRHAVDVCGCSWRLLDMAKDHSPGFLKIVQDAKSRVRECTGADVKQRRERGETFTLIDVREDHEWQAGHLPGAIHLGRGILERDVEKRVPDTSTPIVLYCGG